eukprot:jgi/Tetstr1/421774/TSEL_012677.t1
MTSSSGGPSFLLAAAGAEAVLAVAEGGGGGARDACEMCGARDVAAIARMTAVSAATLQGNAPGAREAVAPRVTFAKDTTKDSDPAAAYGALRRIRRTSKTPTYFIADAGAKAPWSEVMQDSIEALYGTGNMGAKALDLVTTSLAANTYSNCEGKIRPFAKFCIDEEGISPLDRTESTCVRYLVWIAERGTIGAGSLQSYLSAINTFLRHTGRDDAPATGPAIGDMTRALQIRQLKTSEEPPRRAPLPCGVNTNLLGDLATLPMTISGYGTILREGAAVCSTFMFYSRGESNFSCRLYDMAVDTHIITLFVNREKGGHRKRLDGFKPLLQIPTTAVPAWTTLLRRFIPYRDAAFRAAPFAKQPDRF